MKKFVFILMILNFTWAQAMTLRCGVNCAVQESLEKQMSNNGMAENHSCCHGKQDKDEEKKRSKCMDVFSGSCFYEVASDNVVPEKLNGLSYKLIFLKELPILNIIKFVGINNRYRPKIPNDGFLQFKANLNLYILKDQFLI